MLKKIFTSIAFLGSMMVGLMFTAIMLIMKLVEMGYGYKVVKWMIIIIVVMVISFVFSVFVGKFIAVGNPSGDDEMNERELEELNKKKEEQK